MNSLARTAVLACFGVAAFVAAYRLRERSNTPGDLAIAPALAANAPDSVRYSAIGLRPGRQLIAYVISGQGCVACRQPQIREAVASLRHTLNARYSPSYSSIKIVGVAVAPNVQQGVEFLAQYGADTFDEISVGSGWENEHLVRLIWREGLLDDAAPQILVLARRMSATLDPITLGYSADSVVQSIVGGVQLLTFVDDNLR